ncbi:MAG: type VII secretion protein EccCa [Canibacter sp.]
MTKTLVHRPTRSTYPLDQPMPKQLSAPPSLEDKSGGTPLQMLMPIIGAMSSMVMMVVLRNGRPLFMMMAGVIFVIAVISGVLFAFTSRGRAARQARIQRGNYLDYLENLRVELATEADEVRSRALITDPDPHGLHALVRDPLRRWERRRSDRDFAKPRIGLSSRPWFELTVPEDEDPTEPADQLLSNEAQLVADTYSNVNAMPLQVNLVDSNVVTIIGDPAETRSAARALFAQLAVTHSPDDLALAVVCTATTTDEWRGVDRLPHMHEPTLFDGPVPARRIATTTRELATVLHETIEERANQIKAARRTGGKSMPVGRIVVLCDDHGNIAKRLPLPEGAPSFAELGITMIHLLDDRTQEPGDVSTRLTLDGVNSVCELKIQTDEQREIEFTPDQLTVAEMSALARVLAPLQMSRAVRGGSDEEEVIEQFDVTDLLGVSDPTAVEVERLWRPRAESDFLRVPFAVDDMGQPVHLDLKESAQLGMGPHGICVGATGSGKSEMLRTLILSLAVQHPPEDLSMILVDYKGGAAFAPFETLPHTAGLIDNLADDPQLTTRAKASLQGEVVRRQQMLKDAGSSPNISHYRELREEDSSLEPMPHLFVVIDEFGELLTAEPDFIDLFLQIGRIGRSIGVHLLLSSQRIEAGKLRGLDTYLSYRIGLRTFSESESQVVLNTRDAFYLPSMPGYGYLKVDTSIYQRFRAGYVSGPINQPRRVRQVSNAPERQVFALPPLNGIQTERPEDEQNAARDPEPKYTPRASDRVLVDEVVDQLRNDDRAVRDVWLPPLPERLTLSQVIDGADKSQDSLFAVMGLEDKPSSQEQSPWKLDLTKSGGNVMILGAPQSGRSTMLRTIAASLSLTYTPNEVSIYGMDLGGGGLRGIEKFPHVGGVATRADSDKLLRLLEEIMTMMGRREEVMRKHGIDSVAELRRRHRRGELPELESGEIVLLVDGYGTLRQDFDSLNDIFTTLMQRASGLGVHLILTLTRQSELRIAHHPLFGTKIELKLNDPADSIIDRKLAKVIKSSSPGRAITEAQTFVQAALPALEDPVDISISEALDDLATKIAQSWEGPFAAPIRLLPNMLPEADLPDPVDSPTMVPLGLRQDSMTTAYWEWLESDPHMLLLGDTKSGKSSTLRLIADQLIQRYTPEELAIAVVDPRNHVPEAIPEEYLAAHAKSLQQAGGLSESIATELGIRTDLNEEELAKRPHVVMLVDDYDIVSAGGANPLQPLLQHLPMSRDLKFHLIVARPVAGSSRAMYGGVMQMLRDTGGSVLMLSGDRAEGQILPRVYPERFPPGRGRYIRRGERPYIVQVARRDVDEQAAAAAEKKAATRQREGR